MSLWYVSPSGDDQAAGTQDAPLKTLSEAVSRAEVCSREDWDAPARILLRGGVYPLAKPVTVSLCAPLSIEACPGETPILDGSSPLTGFTETIRDGKRLWTKTLPEVAGGEWFFRSLYAGETRRNRASLPKSGYYRIESVPGIPLSAPLGAGSHRFIASPGDLQAFHNLRDAEIHVFHYWVDEHMPIASYDPETREVVSTHRSVFALQDDSQPRYAKYRVEHVREGLTEPGEWYLDRESGVLSYLPEDGETVGETVLYAPRTECLLTLQSCSDISIKGITFRNTDWTLVQDIGRDFPDWHSALPLAAAPQAACNLPGVLNILDSRRCRIEDCTICRTGFYAVDIRRSRSIRISGCRMWDLGGGGVKINGAQADQPREQRACWIRVTDNDIGFGGRVFYSGIGVCSMHASHVTIAHNHIHDLYYTGVSCGWIWGYAESASFANTIAYNHIHTLGHGVLSDMGGVYTLGIQPGTVIRNNRIHDIEKSNYGGWAIYPDEGSSHLVIENNVCYRTSSASFHQHYGRENLVRNNIWAFGREGMIAYSRGEDHNGFTFEHNIVLTDSQPIHVGGYRNHILSEHIRSDLNLYWDFRGKPIFDADIFSDASTFLPLETMQKQGYDVHSLTADPLFRDAEHGDFSLLPDSPAFSLGFVPIDLSHVGVRPPEERT